MLVQRYQSFCAVLFMKDAVCCSYGVEHFMVAEYLFSKDPERSSCCCAALLCWPAKLLVLGRVMYRKLLIILNFQTLGRRGFYRNTPKVSSGSLISRGTGDMWQEGGRGFRLKFREKNHEINGAPGGGAALVE